MLCFITSNLWKVSHQRWHFRNGGRSPWRGSCTRCSVSPSLLRCQYATQSGTAPSLNFAHKWTVAMDETNESAIGFFSTQLHPAGILGKHYFFRTLGHFFQNRRSGRCVDKGTRVCMSRLVKVWMNVSFLSLGPKDTRSERLLWTLTLTLTLKELQNWVLRFQRPECNDVQRDLFCCIRFLRCQTSKELRTGSQ